MRIILLFVVLQFLLLIVSGDQSSFDCPMRELALRFARKIQPFRTKEHFQEVADALNGSPEAQGKCKVQLPDNDGFVYGDAFQSFPLPTAGSIFYVSPEGSDSNPGSQGAPFKTIERAVLAGRKSSPATIVLRQGTYYLTQTINLTPQDNGLTVQNYPAEEVWISGGVPIQPQWKPFNVSTQAVVQQHYSNIHGKARFRSNTATVKYLGDFDTTEQCQKACSKYNNNGQQCTSFTHYSAQQNSEWARQCFASVDAEWNPVPQDNVHSGFMASPNVYVADLSSYKLSNIPGLRVNLERAIRARYPNANPELGFGSTLTANSWLQPNVPAQPKIEINPDTPFRDSSLSFQRYQLGIGGTCENFSPPAGYWCGNHTEGGGAFTYRIPTGMVANRAVLPHTPYKNATGAVVQSWRPYHWASWMFEVGSYNPSSGTFVFSKGGFQGARGENNGEDFYIENVFEELDFPDEWYYDAVTSKLYLWYNATGAPTTDTLFVATQLKTLVNISGAMSTPVKNVTFRGVGFRDTAYTYLDPHGMPSGGDWGLQRSAAVFVEGTESTVFDSCVFTRLDGNGFMLSAYNRNATITRSEFSWIGDTAIAAWGNARGTSVPGMGWDGTDGDQPRFTELSYNFVHELGIWEKQSSFYFQAKSCQNTIIGNIFFNGPRAGINFNDGFGGGSTITENLLFNTCRESGDHGPFNSWDRQVYVTDVLNGKPSVNKAWDQIHHNFIIANYNSQEAIDNDDGSCYYETFENFLAYSGNGMKSDFGGHDNHHHDNLYAYIGRAFSITTQLEGHADYFYQNKVVMTNDGNYGEGQTCSGAGKTVVNNNEIYTPSSSVTECGMSLAQWQSQGNDPGTVAGKWPADEVLLGWIVKLLKL